MSQSAGRYLVADRNGLAGLIQRAVKERFGGSQRRAARELAGPGKPQRQVALQRQVSRLARGETGRIAKETVQSLADLVGSKRHEELRRTLLTPAARLRLNLYRRWIERELVRTREAGRLEKGLRRKHPDLFTRFDGFLAEMDCLAPRVELSFRDVLAPLTRDTATGGIERAASELSPKEMRRYLEHAFAAQRILLHRPSDVARAMENDDLD